MTRSRFDELPLIKSSSIYGSYIYSHYSLAKPQKVRTIKKKNNWTMLHLKNQVPKPLNEPIHTAVDARSLPEWFTPNSVSQTIPVFPPEPHRTSYSIGIMNSNEYAQHVTQIVYSHYIIFRLPKERLQLNDDCCGSKWSSEDSTISCL